MSQTKVPISDICQMISDWRGESSTDTSAGRIRAISRAEQDFAGRKRWRTHRLPDQTITASGSSTETIGSTNFPMRTKGLAEVFVGGITESCRYTIVDYNNFKNLVNQNSTARIVYEYYDATNDAWKIVFNPVPTAGQTIYYTYFWQPADKTSADEYVYCDNPLLIGHLALADIYGQEEEFEKQQLEQRVAEQMIGEMEGDEEEPADNQTYQMSSIENMSRPRGYGSY